MWTHTRRFVVVSCVLLLGACDQTDRTNPMDPQFEGRTGAVRGRIFLQGEQDHSGIHVELLTYDRFDVSDVTDQEGNFQLTDIPVVGASPVTLLASHPGKGDSKFNQVKFDVTVQANSTTEIDSTEHRCLTVADGEPITFDGFTGHLSGFVKLEQQRYHAGAEVRLVYPKGHANLTTSDSSGSFVMRNLPVGNVIIEVTKEEYNRVVYTNFVIGKNSRTVMDLTDVKESTVFVPGDVLYVSRATGAYNIWRMRSDGSFKSQITFLDDQNKTFKDLDYNEQDGKLAYLYGSANEKYWGDALYVATLDKLGDGDMGTKLLEEPAANPSWDLSGAKPKLYCEHLNANNGTTTIRCIGMDGTFIPVPGLDAKGWQEVQPDVKADGKVVFVRYRPDSSTGIMDYQICVYAAGKVKVVYNAPDPEVRVPLGGSEPDIYDSLVAGLRRPHTLFMDLDGDGSPDYRSFEMRDFGTNVSFCKQVRHPKWGPEGSIVFVDNEGSSPALEGVEIDQSKLAVDSSAPGEPLIFYDFNEDGQYQPMGGETVFDPERRGTWMEFYPWSFPQTRVYTVKVIAPGEKTAHIQYEQMEGGEYIERVAVSPRNGWCMVMGRLSQNAYGTTVTGTRLWVYSYNILRSVSSTPGNDSPTWIMEKRKRL